MLSSVLLTSFGAVLIGHDTRDVFVHTIAFESTQPKHASRRVANFA